jgi:hypothetical protein
MSPFSFFLYLLQKHFIKKCTPLSSCCNFSYLGGFVQASLGKKAYQTPSQWKKAGCSGACVLQQEALNRKIVV